MSKLARIGVQLYCGASFYRMGLLFIKNCL